MSKLKEYLGRMQKESAKNKEKEQEKKQESQIDKLFSRKKKPSNLDILLSRKKVSTEDSTEKNMQQEKDSKQEQTKDEEKEEKEDSETKGMQQKTQKKSGSLKEFLGKNTKKEDNSTKKDQENAKKEKSEREKLQEKEEKEEIDEVKQAEETLRRMAGSIIPQNKTENSKSAIKKMIFESCKKRGISVSNIPAVFKLAEIENGKSYNQDDIEKIVSNTIEEYPTISQLPQDVKTNSGNLNPTDEEISELPLNRRGELFAKEFANI